MKCPVLGAIGLLFFLSSLSNAGFGQELTGPKTEIDKQEFVFKEVKEGDIITHSFKVYNKGEQQLEIISVRPG